MEDFSTSDLTITASLRETPAALVLDWRGKSRDQDPPSLLGPYFDRMLASARSSELPIEMRFDRLDNLNSSSITMIVQVIQDARTQAVPMVVVFDPKRRWQRLCFEALRVFVEDDGLLELRPT